MKAQDRTLQSVTSCFCLLRNWFLRTTGVVVESAFGQKMESDCEMSNLEALNRGDVTGVNGSSAPARVTLLRILFGQSLHLLFRKFSLTLWIPVFNGIGFLDSTGFLDAPYESFRMSLE